MSATEQSAHVLLALAAIVGAARLAGWAIGTLRQPRVHGEMLAGIALGPSILGVVWPQASQYVFPAQVLPALQAVANLGVVLFMFLVGLELDVGVMRRRRHGAVVVSLTSMIAPVVLGALVAFAIHERLGGDVPPWSFAMFIGVAMSITAFPVLARVLKETGLSNTHLGALTTTCAAIDDIMAWCLLAVVVTAVKATGLSAAVATILLSLTFVAVMLLVVRPVLAAAHRRGFVVPLWFAVLLALACAWATEHIGIHAIFGAFLAGVVLPREILMRQEIRERLEPVVLTLLVPAFFVVVGLGTRVNQLDSWYLWGVTAAITAVAIVGKLGGAMVAARLVGETWRGAATVGILMNTRGLTELIILTVARQLGIINQTVFTIMVVMALVTTLIATPLLALFRLVPRSPADESAVAEAIDPPLVDAQDARDSRTHGTSPTSISTSAPHRVPANATGASADAGPILASAKCSVPSMLE